MIHLDVKLVVNECGIWERWHFKRTEDGRVLSDRITGKPYMFHTEREAREFADEHGWLITNGKTYVEAYRDEFYPDVVIYDELPEGWTITKGAMTAPRGAAWIHNGPFFIRDESGKHVHNPNFKSAWVLTD